jgi:hypothetical protein
LLRLAFNTVALRTAIGFGGSFQAPKSEDDAAIFFLCHIQKSDPDENPVSGFIRVDCRSRTDDDVHLQQDFFSDSVLTPQFLTQSCFVGEQQLVVQAHTLQVSSHFLQKQAAVGFWFLSAALRFDGAHAKAAMTATTPITINIFEFIFICFVERSGFIPTLQQAYTGGGKIPQQ